MAWSKTSPTSRRQSSSFWAGPVRARACRRSCSTRSSVWSNFPLLRATGRDGTEAGQPADAVMKAAGLVPDATVLGILEELMRQPGIVNGVILDGCPRTAARVEALDSLLARHDMTVDAAVVLTVDNDAMIEWVSGRATCGTCGEEDHDRFKPPAKPDRCDICADETLTRRADKNARNRLCPTEGLSCADCAAYRSVRISRRAAMDRGNGPERHCPRDLDDVVEQAKN